jgi:hypothetical protein
MKFKCCKLTHIVNCTECDSLSWGACVGIAKHSSYVIHCFSVAVLMNFIMENM